MQVGKRRSDNRLFRMALFTVAMREFASVSYRYASRGLFSRGALGPNRRRCRVIYETRIASSARSKCAGENAPNSRWS